MLCKQCPDERILSNKSIQDVSNMFTLYANHLRKAVTYNWSRLHLKSILRLSNTVQCAKNHRRKEVLETEVDNFGLT